MGWVLVGGELLGGLSVEGLMGPVVVVVDEVIEEFVGEVVEVVEGGPVDDILVQGAPEALDLAVGLRPVGPGVAVLDAELEQHGLEGMLFGLLREANSAPLSDRISAK